MKRLIAFLALALPLVAQNPVTAVFPSAVMDDEDLPLSKNFATTTLASGINDSTETITLTDASVFIYPTLLVIDSEVIKACSRVGNVVTVCSGGRGTLSTAATHDSLATVANRMVDYYLLRINAELKATQTALGAALANVNSLDDFTGDTDDVTEGSTNLYFTQARARASIGAGDNMSYSSSTGIVSVVSSVTAGAGAIPKGDGTGRLDTNWLGSGTANSSSFLRGDRSWQAALTSEVNNLESGAAGIADTEVFIGTGSGTGNYAALSGDATLANNGAVTVVDDSHAHTGSTISALDAGDVTTGTFADARISESSVTQYVANTQGLITFPYVYDQTYQYGYVYIPSAVTIVGNPICVSSAGSFTANIYQSNSPFSNVSSVTLVSSMSCGTTQAGASPSETDIAAGKYIRVVFSSPSEALVGSVSMVVE